MKKITKKQDPNFFDKMYFICLAVSKDEDRYNLNYICVDDTNIIATDGHRLHLIYKFESGIDLKNGYYEVIKKTKSEIILNKTEENINYPDYNKIIPEYKSKDFFTSKAWNDKDMFAQKYAQIIRKMDKSTLRYYYLVDALHLGSDSFEIIDENLPIRINNNYGFAIIMPLKLK